MIRASILLVFLLTSCSSVYYREFYISAINTEEKPIDCVVVVDDQVHLDEANDPVLTPASIRIGFKLRSDGGGYEKPKLGVKSVELDASKKIIRGLRDEDIPQYFEDSRLVQQNDPTRQLFILRRNPNYVGPAGN